MARRINATLFQESVSGVGDVLVLDNQGAHRASQVKAIVHACNTRVIWSPPYPPDFFPIEPMWSKLKTYLRKVKARTTAELDRAVVEGLRLVTSVIAGAGSSTAATKSHNSAIRYKL